MDEKWTWGEGGQEWPKMGGRPLYTVPSAIFSNSTSTFKFSIVQISRNLWLLKNIDRLAFLTPLSTRKDHDMEYYCSNQIFHSHIFFVYF